MSEGSWRLSFLLPAMVFEKGGFCALCGMTKLCLSLFEKTKLKDASFERQHIQICICI